MINIDSIRKDFPMLSKEINGKPVIFFDNASTTFKPRVVIAAEMDYYNNFCSNTHSEDYPISQIAGKKFEEARASIAKFINADPKEVAFTSGDTSALNTISYALADKMQPGDEVLLTVAEHASNVLPWFKLAQEKGIVIKYIPLTEGGQLTATNVEKSITSKTKVISIAHVTNVLGYVVDVKAICKIAHQHNVLVLVDGAQSVPHIPTDVKDLDCDFLCFSGHKMVGPTGIGVLYGKYQLLLELTPPFMGGGMNSRFDTCGNYSLMLPPQKFEYGTQNIAGAIGMGVAAEYLMEIGMDNIQKYEYELKKYMVDRLLKEVDGIKIYNPDSDTGIVTFNLKDIFAQDAATHFSSYGICVRSGQHCAKILLDYLKTPATVRASVCFYNTYDEVDKFVEAAKKGDEFLNAFFG